MDSGSIRRRTVGQMTAPTRAACAALLLAAGFAGCDKGPGKDTTAAAPTQTPSGFPSRPMASPDQVLARVNNAVITKQDLQAIIDTGKDAMKQQGKDWTPTKEELGQLLDGLVLSELQAQDAIARGLDRKPDIQQRYSMLFRNFFAQEWAMTKMSELEPTQQEIQEIYDQNRAGFVVPEQIQVRQMVLSSEQSAKDALKRLLDGENFVTVAQQMSSRPELAQGQEAQKPVMRRNEKAIAAPGDPKIRELAPALEQAAFAIATEGATSTYVPGPDNNFHIFQLVRRQAPRPQTLAEVTDLIKGELRRRKAVALTDDLRKKAKVTPFPERLEGLAK